MNGQRGWVGYLFLLALLGGAWFVWGIGGIMSNDYKMKNAMKQALGDYIVFTVNEDLVEAAFKKRCAEQGIDIAGITPQFTLDEGQRNWAKARIVYSRQWTLPYTKKTYTKKFDWEKREER